MAYTYFGKFPELDNCIRKDLQEERQKLDELEQDVMRDAPRISNNQLDESSIVNLDRGGEAALEIQRRRLLTEIQQLRDDPDIQDYQNYDSDLFAGPHYWMSDDPDCSMDGRSLRAMMAQIESEQQNKCNMMIDLMRQLDLVQDQLGISSGSRGAGTRLDH
ncbi:hypothetical protein QAD02_015534 [Eretmocerus hayati]|uniref:Uncharacterized protein n=1 Tax=Eretmocerus hayati TaxID=131215 RepID=A0ACC2P8W6_9HYME|nr:hypothetical protein QAD02_015534 [Eretmocerus hayati]